jgi:hypothetical protein
MDQVTNCRRHRRFPTGQAARGAVRVLRARRRYRGISAYPCREGGIPHWHVGHGRRR